MHLAALNLIPLLGAEKSKVPFYVAGGLLICWALLVSLGLGTRRPEFPSNSAGERLVIAVSAVLVVATTAMAIATSGGGA